MAVLRSGGGSIFEGVPRAKKTIVKGTGIAGNVDTTKTVPANERWLLLNVMIELTTDGTVANRYPGVVTQDDANVKKYSVTSDAIAASVTQDKYWTQSVSATSERVNALGVQILDTDEDVVMRILNGVAGDSYDYLLEYLVIATK